MLSGGALVQNLSAVIQNAVRNEMIAMVNVTYPLGSIRMFTSGPPNNVNTPALDEFIASMRNYNQIWRRTNPEITFSLNGLWVQIAQRVLF
jgi:hypothetical protein